MKTRILAAVALLPLLFVCIFFLPKFCTALVFGLAGAIGATLERENLYGGWAYAEQSAIREAYSAACEATVGRKPRITVIHAGLESGTVKREIPDMDIISCGPQVRGLHSPDEALCLASFETFFAIMEHLLQSL